MSFLRVLVLSTALSAPAWAGGDEPAADAKESAVAAPAPSGRIQGGWSYVIAAYGITWTALAGYAASLYARSRREAVS
jgi:hypothetical protein